MKNLDFRWLVCLLIFLNVSCAASNNILETKEKFETVFLDAVTKELKFDQAIPESIKSKIKKWFDDKVKVDGLEGKAILIINDYAEEITNLDSGKRIDIKINFSIIIENKSSSNKILVSGKVSAFGSLTGTFSLSEFDNLVSNTQNDLILRLSRDLSDNF